VLEVTTDLQTEYALAWRAAPEPHVPTLAALALDAGGTARITVNGLVGQAYELGAAPEPGPDWTPLITNTPTAVPFDLLDPGAASASRRVYRVRALNVAWPP
jgi:hypothetical protein